ncbi:unnamed protein product, partial [Hapterophycus canaliculatus]
QVGSRICLSASEYHQESWQPSWTVTSLVTALVAHMTEPAAEIGSVQGATRSQKRKAAARSRGFECAVCGCCHQSFPEEKFPRPKGFEKGRDVPQQKQEGTGAAGGAGSVEGGTRGRRRERGGRGVVEGGVGGSGAGLAGRSRLSRVVCLVTNKAFLLVVALIVASLYLNQPPSRS